MQVDSQLLSSASRELQGSLDAGSEPFERLALAAFDQDRPCLG
ncbi:MAG TPA: hypothetical protein PL137_01305 [Nocardioides sp.]|nr:hypothetical protein [Nocardioides sp.]